MTNSDIYAPSLTPDEIEAAFRARPYLDWLRDKVRTHSPFSRSDEVQLWLARSRLSEAAGQIGEALRAVENGEALAEGMDDPTLVGLLIVQRAKLSVRAGQYAEAERDAQAALALLGEHPETAHAYSILGACATENDRYAEAEEHHLTAAASARLHGYDQGMAIALHNLAHINLWRGRLDLALRYAGEADGFQRTLGLTPQTYPLYAVQVHLIRNQRAEAWVALELLSELTEREPLFAVFVAIFGAHLHLDEENFDAAQREAERAFTLAVRVGMPAGDILARTVNSRLHRLLRNPIRAIEWAKDAVSHARRVGYGYMVARALIEEGAAHRENANPVAAAECWHEAIGIAERIGACHEQAQALLLLASLRRAANHTDADEWWRRASECILENGYTFLLEKERAIAFPLVADYARSDDVDLRRPAERLLGRLVGFAALPLHIVTLGGFVVRRGAHLVDHKALQRRRSGELFRFLLAQPTLRAPRDVVLETLWPDQASSKGQDLLHQATSTLRRALEPDLPDKFPSSYLQVDGDHLSLNLPSGSTVDLHRFAGLMQKAEPSTEAVSLAISLYGGDLFVEDRYADWAVERRDELSELFHQALLLRAGESLAKGDARGALRDCNRILRRDPCYEDAAYLSMRAHLSLANRPGALRVYDKLEVALDQELQIAPREEIALLATTLRSPKRAE